MKSIVLGSDGFIGTPFCKYLETLGEQVIRIDIKHGESQDLRNMHLQLDGIDRVYFLAWDVGGAKYLYREDSQFRQLDWNLNLLLNVMPQLKYSQTPFLFVSSQLAEEYDTVYGVTKRLGEVWTHLLDGVRVRLWNVYGPLEKPSERTHVISDFVFQAVENKCINMLTTGLEMRQFIHIDDVCRALHIALDGKFSGVYDISSFEWVSVLSAAQIIASETGAEIIPGKITGATPITPMVGRVPGWLPEVSFFDGLKRMVYDIKKTRN